MKILVSKKANSDYHKIIEYLGKKWGNKSVEKFEATLNDFLDILEQFPEIGSIEFSAKNIRGFQLNKQIRVFYTVRSEYILLVSLFDVRQNPKKRNQ